MRKCAEFYAKCYKHRNEEHYDEEKQRNRMKKWCERIKHQLENGSEMQLIMNVKTMTSM